MLEGPDLDESKMISKRTMQDGSLAMRILSFVDVC